MLKKGTILYSVFKNKCPRCNEGEFLVASPYVLSKAGEFHKNCSHCGLKFEKEPGFYYGAMYVSYALAVAVFVTLWTSMNLFFTNIPIAWQIGVIIFATIVLTPYLYALSKLIWANIFIRYDKKFDNPIQRRTHS